ncbi:MAG: hypothetical protein JWQ81_4173 [Amycolatopsis sp.]|uniref:WXG100 family type VII secretion target n=1 Tax=Amycolatopsis sp. TaxID=37632 RepID=UPI0026165AD3|nr:endo-1,4-beta-glucanase [Amycolatopsis sp.]MCU1683434.1 hypothetical protein [Amycolatopsis sp.]
MSDDNLDGPATESIAHPLSRSAPGPASAFSGLNALAGLSGHFGYLSELAGELGVVDVVATYFTPIAGRWGDLHSEAARWRAAADVAGSVSAGLGEGLGRVDAEWAGTDAEAFAAYIGEIAVAGGDAEDAMNAMADALCDTADALQQIVTDLSVVLVDAAELTSESAMLPVGGERRARAQLIDAGDSGKALFDAARDVLEAFGRFCNGVDAPDAVSPSIEISHPYPRAQFVLHNDRGSSISPQASEDSGSTSPSSASGDDQGHAGKGSPDQGRQTSSGVLPDVSAPLEPPPVPDPSAAASAGGGGMMMPMGIPLGGGGRGAARDRKPQSRPVTQPSELFGEPDKVVAPVIGEDAPHPDAHKR